MRVPLGEARAEMHGLEHCVRSQEDARDFGVVSADRQEPLLRIGDGDIGPSRVDLVGQLYGVDRVFLDDVQCHSHIDHHRNRAILGATDLHGQGRVSNFVDGSLVIAAASSHRGALRLVARPRLR
jgi:hypothetical protein